MTLMLHESFTCAKVPLRGGILTHVTWIFRIFEAGLKSFNDHRTLMNCYIHIHEPLLQTDTGRLHVTVDCLICM